MARRHDPAVAWRYERIAATVADAIEQHLWSEEHGRYLRSRWVARKEGPAELPEQFARQLPYPNRSAWGAIDVDARVDVSLLGLAWPFGVVDPALTRMRATVAAIEHELRTANGGVRRYSGDEYAGGNTWVLATLWLGLYYRQVGDEAGFRRCVEWPSARRHRWRCSPSRSLQTAARPGSSRWAGATRCSYSRLGRSSLRLRFRRSGPSLLRRFVAQAATGP